MGTYLPQDYLIYLGILLLVYFFCLKVVFTKLKLDRKFLLASLPFVLFGVLVRVLADTPLVEASKWWSITPGVYLITISIALISIFIGLRLKKEQYWLIPFSVGSLGSLFLFSTLWPYFLYPERIFYPFLLAFFITFLVYLVSRGGKIKIFQKVENLLIIFAHLLDGSATFIAYNFYGFGEEHLLPLYLIKLVGDNALIMIPAKLVLILLVLYLIERYAEKQESKLLKFLIFILGIGPGLRDSLLPSLDL